MTELHNTLDPWLGKPKYKQTKGRVTFSYRFETEVQPVKTMKLKVEINTREHGSELELMHIPFSVENGWFSGKTTLQTYALEELVGTKLRALYQRRKGRDLFDLYHILMQNPDLNVLQVVDCFQKYLAKDNLNIYRAEFEENMHMKLQSILFTEDIKALLSHGKLYDQKMAYVLVHEKLFSQLPGDPWLGNTAQ